MADTTAALESDGVTIVPGVLSELEQKQMRDGYWDFFEYITHGRVLRNDISTWDNIKEWLPNHGMLFQHHRVGHMQAVWDVRQNPNVVQVFADLYGKDVDEMTCSMDGVSFELPKSNKKKTKAWWHVDQAPCRSNQKLCVQGWVTAEDVGAGDATLAVLKGSHRMYSEFCTEHGFTSTANWFKLDESHVSWFIAKGCKVEEVKCKAGSLVLWDSRTVHYGKPSEQERAFPRRVRYVAYVSYAPSDLMSNKERLKKITIAEKLRMTTHWPCRYLKMFPEKPRLYPGDVMPPVAAPIPPRLTALGTRLIGYTDPTACTFYANPKDPDQSSDDEEPLSLRFKRKKLGEL